LTFRQDGCPGFVDTHAHWTEIRRGILDTQNWSSLRTRVRCHRWSRRADRYQRHVCLPGFVDSGDILGQRAFSTARRFFPQQLPVCEEVKVCSPSTENNYGTHNIKSYVVGNRQAAPSNMVQASKRTGDDADDRRRAGPQTHLTHVIDGFHGNEHTLPIAPLYTMYPDVCEIWDRRNTNPHCELWGPLRRGLLGLRIAKSTTMQS